MMSSDEGEIIENDAKDMKATSLSRAAAEGHAVDRQDRNRSRGSSPDHDTASRYSGSSRRSRSPRGHKRPRDDRGPPSSYGRSRDYDARSSRPAYDDRRRDSHQRTRISYEDLDRPPSRGSHYSHDGRERERSRDRGRYRRDSRDRDRYPEKRPRHSSRSPNRSRRDENGKLERFVRATQPDRRPAANGYPKYEEDRPSRARKSQGPRRRSVGETAHSSNGDAKLGKGHSHDESSSRNGYAQS